MLDKELIATVSGLFHIGHRSLGCDALQPHFPIGSLAASPVARWRGSYAPAIGLEGLTTGAAEMGRGRVLALSRGACVQDAAITDCHRRNAAIRHVGGRGPARYPPIYRDLLLRGQRACLPKSRLNDPAEITGARPGGLARDGLPPGTVALFLRSGTCL
jgi:hypothetical protein